MFSRLKWIFKGGPAAIRACIGQRQLGTRTLGAWAAVAFAWLKELAPYAVVELLLPGGSVVALTLWFYRRRRKIPGLARSLNALL
jgi:hypothetical protein